MLPQPLTQGGCRRFKEPSLFQSPHHTRIKRIGQERRLQPAKQKVTLPLLGTGRTGLDMVWRSFLLWEALSYIVTMHDSIHFLNLRLASKILDLTVPNAVFWISAISS